MQGMYVGKDRIGSGHFGGERRMRPIDGARDARVSFKLSGCFKAEDKSVLQPRDAGKYAAPGTGGGKRADAIK